MTLKKVKTVMDKILRLFEGAAKAICVLSIVMVFVMCLQQVFCRFVLHVSVGYVDELSRYLFILSVFVGSCLSVKDDEHFSLDLLPSLLSKRPKMLAVVKIAGQIAIGIFLIFMIRSGFILAASTGAQSSSYLHMSMYVMYLLIPLCGIWMLVYVIIKIVKQILVLCDRNEGEEVG